MQAYKAHEWQAASKETRLELDTRHSIQVQVSCNQDVQLLGVREKAEIPLKVGREFRVKMASEGFEAIILRGTDKITYGYCLKEMPRQDGEPLNNLNPPSPPLPGDDNLLLQIRNIARQEMMRTRMPNLDPEDLPFFDRYEIPEDEDELFEEEIIQSQQKSRKSKLPDESSDDPPDPPAAPEALTQKEETPSGAQPATEQKEAAE